MNFNYKYLLICVLITQISCKPEKLKWEPRFLVPLVKTSLGIDDIVNDIVNDSLLSEENDNSLTLIYRQNIETISLKDLVELPSITYSTTTSLSNIALTNSVFKADITLGMISNDLPIWGPFIISQNGTDIVLPDITDITSGPHPVNIENIFSEATFSQGFMDITLRNDFPADVANLDYKIENANSGTEFITHSFLFVASGSTESTTIDLAGKTVEGNLNAFLLNMDFLVGNQSVFIDTSKALDITITLRDLIIETATAKFPSQEVVNDKVEIRLDLEDAKLKLAKLNSGNVVIDVISTAQDSIFFNFSIPGASKNGISFYTNPVIPPAQAGGNVLVTYTYDFSDYELDLTGISGNESNLLYSELIASIDSSGNLITLSESDSLRINLKLENIKPSYAEGFLGSLEYNIGPEDISFDIFKNVISGGISLENVTTYFSIENGIGVDAELNINKLNAYNSSTNNSVDLVSGDIASPIQIFKAIDPPLMPSITSFQLDNQNSNITDLINILPDRLSYELALFVNQGVDSTTSSYQDFVYVNSGIKSSIDIEMPLSLIANNLTLSDTIELTEETLIEFDGVESGNLNFIVDNGFPLSTNFELYFIDDQNNVYVSLVSEEKIEAAPVSNGRVINPLRSVLSFPLSSTEISNVSKSTKFLLIAEFNSDNSSFLKIYSDYKLKSTLSGDFIYKVNE